MPALATPPSRQAPSAPPAVVAQLRRLARDYAHWAGAVYRIRDKGGRIVPLVLKPLQRAIGEAEARLLREYGRARIFVLKARQGGVTTDQQARSLHTVWSQPGSDALTLAHERDATDKIFDITLRAMQHFPPALLPAMGARETREISFPRLDTHFWTGTAGAKRSGRGVTIRRFHGSEFAFWDNPRGTLKAVSPGLVPVGSVAVLETTASGLDSAGHQFWQECSPAGDQRRGNGYLPLFFPWWECDPEHYRLPLEAPDELTLRGLEPEERELVRVHGLSLEQVKWRRWKIAEMGSRADFLQEYAEDPETCWLAAGGLYYDVETVKALLLKAPAPVDVQMNGALEVYCGPASVPAGERVIVGSDTSEGGAEDRQTFVARSFPSWTLLARYASSEATPEELADHLNTWGRRYSTRNDGGAGRQTMPALLVIEKNMHGITTLRRLRDVHNYPAERLYHRQAFDRDKARPVRELGWHTSAESRPIMLDAGRQLLSAALAGRAGVPSKAALRDALAVRRDPNTGKVILTGRDVLVAEMLAWIGRDYPLSDRNLDPNAFTTIRG